MTHAHGSEQRHLRLRLRADLTAQHRLGPHVRIQCLRSRTCTKTRPAKPHQPPTARRLAVTSDAVCGKWRDPSHRSPVGLEESEQRGCQVPSPGLGIIGRAVSRHPLSPAQITGWRPCGRWCHQVSAVARPPTGLPVREGDVPAGCRPSASAVRRGRRHSAHPTAAAPR